MDPQREAQLSQPDVQVLVEAVMAAHTQEQVQALLVDLCTSREISDMDQRLQVAQMLDEGQPYAQVQRVTGASSTTVSRVSKFLNGDVGGYRWVLDTLNASAKE